MDVVLLSQSPAVQARLQEEVGRCLGGRLPTVADMPSLTFVERVVTEAMRLYPPAWLIGRRGIEPFPIGRYLAPARTIFLMSQWVMHHDRRHFPEPERFNPDRWTPEFKAALPPFVLSIRRRTASVHWRVVCLDGARPRRRDDCPAVEASPCSRSACRAQPLVTLRTKYGMRMTVEDV